MYALIKFAGKQYKVEENSSIKVPYVDGKVGNKITFDQILYMDDGKNIKVGTPLVNGVKISGEIEAHGRERKVVVFKFKRRKGYQKKNTHMQKYTILKIGKLGTGKKSTATKNTAAPASKKAAEKKETVKKRVPKTPEVKKENTKKGKE